MHLNKEIPNIKISDKEPNNLKTREEIKRLIDLFAKEFIQLNTLKTNDMSLFKRLTNSLLDVISRICFKHDYTRMVEIGLKESTLPEWRRIYETYKIYTIRDEDKANQLVGFSIANISYNLYREESGIKELYDKSELESKKIGEKCALYLLPEYRKFGSIKIDNHQKDTRIVIELNKKIDQWFQKENIDIQYIATGIRMKKNIIAYMMNGFFIQKKDKNCVFMKKEEANPITFKQKIFLLKNLKQNRVLTYNHAYEIPEDIPNVFDKKYPVSKIELSKDREMNADRLLNSKEEELDKGSEK